REGVRRDRGWRPRGRGSAHAGAGGDAWRGRRARRHLHRDPDAGEARRRQYARQATPGPDVPQPHPVRPRRPHSPPDTVSVGTLVRRQSYRDLLVGQAVSALGDWMGTVAFMALTLAITGSPAAGLILGSSYGSIPLGAAAFAAVAALPGSDIGGRTHALVFWIDALTFLVSFACIAHATDLAGAAAADIPTENAGFRGAFRIPLVRAVMPAAAAVALGLGAL